MSAPYSADGLFPEEEDAREHDEEYYTNPGEDSLDRPLLPGEDSHAPSQSQSQSQSQSRTRTRRRSFASDASIFDVPITADNVPWRQKLMTQATQTYDKFVETWLSFSILQKILATVFIVVGAVCGLLLLIFSGRLIRWVVPKAAQWEKSHAAGFVVWLLTFCVSFPPLVGWALIGTLAGFIFGVWKGWLIYSTGTVLGSTVAVYASRTILQHLVRRWVEHDHRFKALSLTLKYDGLKLLCMIRLCPLPYSMCNGAIATFDTVHPLMYCLATFIVTPKLLITVFVGSRLRILLEQGQEMSLGMKLLNLFSILVTVTIGVGTALYIYKSTLARAEELKQAEQERLAQYGSSSLPSPQVFADSPTNPTPRDEEQGLEFHDDEDNDEIAMPPVDHREFTDNEDDVFDAGDGSESGDAASNPRESFRLHRKVDSR